MMATLLLPFREQENSQKIAMAMVWLLNKYFGIKLDADQVVELERKEKADFIIPSDKGPFCREIHLDFTAERPHFKVVGTPPEEGANGYTEVAFDWKKRSGKVHENGTIDWKKINSIPNVEANALLATVYDKTDGIPGIDCFGKVVKQRTGERQKVHWSKVSVKRDDEREGMPSFKLHATKSGVIIYDFDTPDDPRTLSNLSITDKLIIGGDIDYSMGDLESAASLDISGSVLGNFSLHSEGYIKVAESIEGKEVSAQKISSDIITNRCVVKAVEEVEAGNITMAEAEAEDILVKQNASQAKLHARQAITFAANAAVMGVEMETKSVLFDTNAFSGENIVRLGSNLFQRTNLLLPEMTRLKDELVKLGEDMREAVTDILSPIPKIERFEVCKSTVVRNLLTLLKGKFAQCFKEVKPIDDELVKHCHALKEHVEERVFDYSISRPIEKLCQALPVYNNIFDEFAKCRNEQNTIQLELDNLIDQIRSELHVTINSPRITGINASLKIICGGDEMVLDKNDLNNGNKVIRYKAPEDILRVSKGKLTLEK